MAVTLEDTAKTSVAQLRETLVSYGLTQDEADAIKGKQRLVEEVNDMMNASESEIEVEEEQEVFDVYEEDEEETNTVEEDEEDDISPSDPGWSDYLIGFLDDKEKDNGHPTLNGLRRLAQHFLGDIVSLETQVHQSPTKDNRDRATVSCKISFFGTNFFSPRTISAVADAYWGNIDKNTVYAKFPTAMADSRAESRVLRRALQIQEVSADETFKEIENPNDEEGATRLINDSQIDMLEVMGQKLDIDIRKLIGKEIKGDIEHVKLIDYNQALSLVAVINTYQQDKSLIPEDLKPFNKNWKL